MANVSQEVDLLLVEDSPDHIELASRVFQRLGQALNVHIIQDGQEALDYIFSQGSCAGKPLPRIKLIILDLYLPRIGGIDILKQIRSDARTQDTPVAILSITGNERSTLEQPPYRLQHYLRKPLELNDFLRLYETYIKNR